MKLLTILLKRELRKAHKKVRPLTENRQEIPVSFRVIPASTPPPQNSEVHVIRSDSKFLYPMVFLGGVWCSFDHHGYPYVEREPEKITHWLKPEFEK